MPAPNTVVVNPGVKLMTGTVTTTGLTYQVPTPGAGGSVRVRITSVTLVDTTKANVTATISISPGTQVLTAYALPNDGSPFTLTLNESIDGSEIVTVSASANSAVHVRMTGEEIWVT